MQITAEYLKSRKANAEQERDRLAQALHQLDGAIGIMAILIREAETPEPEPEPEKIKPKRPLRQEHK